MCEETALSTSGWFLLSLLQTSSCGKVLLHLPHRLRTVAYQPHAPFGFCFVLVVVAAVAVVGLAQEHDLERCLNSLLLIAVAPKSVQYK